MKKRKQDLITKDAVLKSKPDESEKLRRDQEKRIKGMGPKNCLPESKAPGLNEKEDEDEMENMYREEENRGAVEAA